MVVFLQIPTHHDNCTRSRALNNKVDRIVSNEMCCTHCRRWHSCGGCAQCRGRGRACIGHRRTLVRAAPVREKAFALRNPLVKGFILRNPLIKVWLLLAIEGPAVALALEAARATSTSLSTIRFFYAFPLWFPKNSHPCTLALDQPTTEEPAKLFYWMLLIWKLFASPISAIKLRLSKLDINDIRAGHNGKKRKDKEQKWHGEPFHHCHHCYRTKWNSSVTPKRVAVHLTY